MGRGPGGYSRVGGITWVGCSLIGHDCWPSTVGLSGVVVAGCRLWPPGPDVDGTAGGSSALGFALRAADEGADEGAGATGPVGA